MKTKALMPQWKALNQIAESNRGRQMASIVVPSFDAISQAFHNCNLSIVPVIEMLP